MHSNTEHSNLAISETMSRTRSGKIKQNLDFVARVEKSIHICFLFFFVQV